MKVEFYTEFKEERKMMDWGLIFEVFSTVMLIIFLSEMVELGGERDEK